MQILTHKPKGRRFDFRKATVWAAELRKVPAWRIALEVVLLARGRGKLTTEEYFQQGAWRPGLSWSERREFLGVRPTKALNVALNPPPDEADLLRMNDKIISRVWLDAAGVPMPNRLAVAAIKDPKAAAQWLATPAATLEFLRSPGALPCFGKPAHSSIGRGAVSLMGLNDAGDLIIGGGRTVTPEALVAEIWASHPRGFVFDELIVPHQDLAAMVGPVIGTLRVTTIDAGSGPEVLYTALRAPAVGATVDSSSGPLGIMLNIDPVTGGILRLQDRLGLGGLDLAASPITGRALVGEVLPDFPAALEAALAAHRALPERGIVGTDIMLSNRGPVVGEVNSSPFHSVYQTAYARGFMNRDILPKLMAVRARFEGSVPLPKDCPLK